MENNNIDTQAVTEILNELQSKVSILSQKISSLKASSSGIRNCAEKLNSYNGKRITGSSTTFTKQIPSSYDIGLYKTWKVANITGVDEILSALDTIDKRVQEFEDALSQVSSFIQETGTTNEYMAYEIAAIGGLISINPDEDMLRDSGLTTKSAEDEYSVLNGNYTGISDENIQWWTDNPIKFVPVTNGTGQLVYRIDQQDESGKWIPMKFTDVTTAYRYLTLAKAKQNDEMRKDVSTDEAREYQKKLRNFGKGLIGASLMLDKFSLEDKSLKSSIETDYNAASSILEAKTEFANDWENATYRYLDNNTFMTVTNGKVGNDSVQITHYRLAHPEKQVKVVQANGEEYKGGVETATHAYNRLKSEGKKPIGVINASNFNQSEGSEWYGTQDFEGANKIAIVHNKLVDTKSGNGTLDTPSSALAGGAEIAVGKNGRFSRIASGTSAQQLIDQGVQDTISIHETPLVMTDSNGNGYVSATVDDASDSAYYTRNVVGQTASGDIYIVTGMTDKRKVAEYMLNELGCNFATSMDQGGSVSNVINGEEIYNQSEGERAVGDFIVIYGD